MDVTTSVQSAAGPSGCRACGCPDVRTITPGIVQCAACSHRVAFDQEMPRVVVQPHTDRRFVVLSIASRNVSNDDGTVPSSEPVQIVVDKALAKMIASALYSVGG